MGVEERFMKKVEFDPNSGCWLWTGSLSRDGYGTFSLDGKARRATHVSLELFKGTTKPDRMVVCHSCNTPSCVNPDHLSYDTTQNNTKYRDSCGRQSKGTHRHTAKLDDNKVREIRLKIVTNKSLTSIAKEYGVSQQTISSIKLGTAWKHVV